MEKWISPAPIGRSNFSISALVPALQPSHAFEERVPPEHVDLVPERESEAEFVDLVPRAA
jgi:hypothetical protein